MIEAEIESPESGGGAAEKLWLEDGAEMAPPVISCETQ